MPTIYYNRINSPQSTIVNTDSNLEHKIGELYCYGSDNYENEPPKLITVNRADGVSIYSGRVQIPGDENELISLDPHLTEDQREQILSTNTIVKQQPSEFGDETDDESADMDGGKRKTKKIKRHTKRKKTLVKQNKRKSRKNLARGFSLAPLRSTKRSASSRPIRSLELRPLRPPSNSTRRRVQINTPENVIQEYSLGSSEKEFKRATPLRGIPQCKNPKYPHDFPCKKKRTIFKNKKAYDKYRELAISRNVSTDYKSRSEHYDDVELMLTNQGYDLLRK
jgi:hypothetical protein